MSGTQHLRRPVLESGLEYSARFALRRWFPSKEISLGCGLVLSIFCLSVTLKAADGLSFATPQDAISALTRATHAHDTNRLEAIFGPSARELLSTDVIQATEEFDAFAERLTEGIFLVQDSATRETIELGADRWPFPIPLVKDGSRWVFDTAAGGEEILNRRIGRNEVGAIRVCRAYVQAQREYAAEDRGGDGVLEYAQTLRSHPGKKDGLYWPVKPGEDLSPLGPLVAQAHREGYRKENKILNDPQTPYHGYYFQILTRQGKHAPGGKYNYLINGHMLAGFALIAWPADWSKTGIMTFIVNQQGVVYSKNLGAKTAEIAPRMQAYDPDGSWHPATCD